MQVQQLQPDKQPQQAIKISILQAEHWLIQALLNREFEPVSLITIMN